MNTCCDTQVDYQDLMAALNQACADQNLQPEPSFLAKVIQLHETTLVRHGLMLVGPTMAGKTSAYRALATACTTVANNGNASFNKVGARGVVEGWSVWGDRVPSALTRTTTAVSCTCWGVWVRAACTMIPLPAQSAWEGIHHITALTWCTFIDSYITCWLGLLCMLAKDLSL